MKNLSRYILLLTLAFVMASAGVHRFYVSVFQMEYVPVKKEIRITGRIFIDDLEAGLNKKYGKKLYLGTPKESGEATGLLKKYFAEKIVVKINNKPKVLTLLGRETEDDVLICYFTLPAESKVQTIQVSNTVLFDMFSEQQNIIHTTVNGNKKSLLLTNSETSGTVQF
ncbi:hypothetical protein FMM05_03920 [Flavobacterium zepuense]|uniref:Peptidase E n=1 Tax=Flavobacterium zepuense TaxID=2593302 RepID=A0A552V7T6_9FLAO|nr:DUF6702 family protein [Flavobacterium zepuense]TRW26533.1 hypothetical protein FMM05_03920 [Flavobacterium zepuense]